MILLAWLFGVIVFIVAVAVAVAFLNRFYRKTSRDVALIRTGFGGQKIVLSGGMLALPFLHKVDEVNMRTMRVEVSRAGAKSLITQDRMRVDAELEFYLRVQPTVDGVATAAQAIGSKSLGPEGVRNLLEGRFIDAIQATAAGLTMDSLHDRRAEFVRTILDSVRDNLAHSGLQLESVSLTRMDQAAFAALDDNNAFNAVGLRKLAEIIATSKKQRAEIEADADVSVRQTQLEAIKQRLDLSRQEEQAQIAQRLEIEKLKAASDAETARARELATVASENARIDREKETRLAEIQQAARAAAPRDRGTTELRGAQGRQLDRAVRSSTPRRPRRRPRPSARAPRSCWRRSKCRPSASARWPSARARSRSSASRSAARSRRRRRRARPRCC